MDEIGQSDLICQVLGDWIIHHRTAIMSPAATLSSPSLAASQGHQVGGRVVSAAISPLREQGYDQEGHHAANVALVVYGCDACYDTHSTTQSSIPPGDLRLHRCIRNGLNRSDSLHGRRLSVGQWGCGDASDFVVRQRSITRTKCEPMPLSGAL